MAKSTAANDVGCFSLPRHGHDGKIPKVSHRRNRNRKSWARKSSLTQTSRLLPASPVLPVTIRKSASPGRTRQSTALRCGLPGCRPHAVRKPQTAHARPTEEIAPFCILTKMRDVWIGGMFWDGRRHGLDAGRSARRAGPGTVSQPVGAEHAPCETGLPQGRPVEVCQASSSRFGKSSRSTTTRTWR